MLITIDTSTPPTFFEVNILRALLTDPEEPSFTAPAPAPKPAEKPSPAPKPVPVPVAPEAKPEPVEDVLGAGTATLEDAVAKATALVAAGKTAAVKAALIAAGCKRVSELKGAAIQTFLDAL